MVELKKQGFNSLGEFFDASEELNIQELGFTSREDFEIRATEVDIANLMEMWK